MIFININTQATEIPDQIGDTFGITAENSWEMLKGLGWRRAELPPDPAEGYERGTIVYIQDPNDPEMAVPQYTDTLIQDRLDAEAAARDAQMAQFITDNAERYVFQNAFLLLCDDIRGDSSHLKLTMDEISTYLLTVRPTDPTAYEVKRDALLMLNAKLTRVDVLWWDGCEWVDDATIVAQAEALYNQIVG